MSDGPLEVDLQALADRVARDKAFAKAVARLANSPLPPAMLEARIRAVPLLLEGTLDEGSVEDGGQYMVAEVIPDVDDVIYARFISNDIAGHHGVLRSFVGRRCRVTLELLD